MSPLDPGSNLCIDPLLEMYLEVEAHDNLEQQGNRYRSRKFIVDIVSELASLVHMTKEVPEDRKHCAGHLYWDMPS